MSKQRSKRTRRAFLATIGAATTVLAGCTGGGGNSGNSGGGGNGGGGGGGNGSTGTSMSGGNGTAMSDNGTMSGENGTSMSSGNESTTGSSGSMGNTLTVFNAGSLEAPFSDAEKPFSDKYGVQVNMETKGSTGSTKKITELGRKADILGVSDFRLIRDMMIPKFADWYSVFATNAMTIAYTDQSTGADEIGPENWGDVLSRDDVRFAHSDPAVDPNGYRSVMSMQLGAMSFRGNTLFDEATSKKLIDKAIVPSGTETELVGQLQSGQLDYAWEYESSSASQDVKTVDLTPQVDLSKATAEYAKFYGNATVKAGGETYVGAPIAYGITVPSVAEAPQLGARWVQFMITQPGRKILSDNGFSPVTPAVVPQADQSAVPKPVLDNAAAKETLGPLQL